MAMQRPKKMAGITSESWAFDACVFQTYVRTICAGINCRVWDAGRELKQARPKAFECPSRLVHLAGAGSLRVKSGHRPIPSVQSARACFTEASAVKLVNRFS